MLTQLIDDIKKARERYLRSKIVRLPTDKFRASDIHECDLAMCYSILQWPEKALHSTELQSIFERGLYEERVVIAELERLGFSLFESQTPFEIKNKKGEVICRGHIDGKILYNGFNTQIVYPIEIKSMNMNTFAALNSLEDFKKRPLHRKYLRQMQLYLYGSNQEEGLFILSDLQGHYKFIPIILDFEEVERIISRLERLWEENIKTGILPKPMDFDDKICSYCAFKHICPCTTKYEGATMIDDKELENKLERRAELKPLVDEYDSLDESIRKEFTNVGDVTVGVDWIIKVKEFERKNYNVPTDIKAKYLEIKTYKKIDIIKL